MRLFCFPYAGGGVHVFRAWADNLPKTVEVCPIQLPGRGARMMEAPYTRMVPLVHAAAEALLPHLDKPFAFFGHSMGALVSFEVARWLRRQTGPEPIRLFVSGCFAPDIPGFKLEDRQIARIMQNLRITKKRARVSNAQTFHIIRDGLFYKIEN